MTFEQSMAVRLASIFSSEDSLAEERAQPAKEREWVIQRLRSGGRWPESLANFDPDSSCWRTSRISLLSPEETLGERFSGTWPRSGMSLLGTAYRLPPLAPLTDVIGSSPLLPTPTSHPRTHTPRQVDHGAQLVNELVKLLPTPMARSNSGTQVSGKSREGGRMLEERVKLLPTPATADARGSRNKTSGRKSDSQHHSGTTLQDVVYEWTGESSDQQSSGGKASSDLRLSPWFVEWMMGAPEGWSDPDFLLSATEFRSTQATSSVAA